MTTVFERTRLQSAQCWTRLGILGAGLIGALMLRAIDPASAWLPFRASCGALTGLPCLFCGMTRALHHLLNGDFASAFYFNWLAFPLALVGVIVSAKLAAELLLRRRFLVQLSGLRCTPRKIAFGFALLVSLWVLQVTLALAGHKHELLNPHGMLYALLVR